MVINLRRWSLGIAVASLMLSSLPASANDAEGVIRLGNQQSAGVIRISDHAKQVSAIVRGQTPCDSDGCFAMPVAPNAPVPPQENIPSVQPNDPGAYSPAPPVPATGAESANKVEGVSYESQPRQNCVAGSCPSDNNSYGQCQNPNCQQGSHCPDCEMGYNRYTLGSCNEGLHNSKLACWLRGQCSMYRARNRYSSMILESSIEADCQEKHEWLRCKFGYFVPTGCCGAGCPPVGHYSMVYPVDPNHFDQRDGDVYAAQGYGGPVSVPLAPVVNHTYNYGWGIPSSRLTPVSRPTH